MSQLTERMVRNFIRGFNEAFGDTAASAVIQHHKDHIAGIRMSGETSMTLVVGNCTAWFDDNWELCGPPELLQSLAGKAKEETRRLAQAGFEKARLAMAKEQPKPAMDMSLLSIHEED